MQARHPEMETIEVADQGHVPSLDSPDLIRRIGEFIAACDSHAKRSAVERGNAEFVTGRDRRPGDAVSF